MAVGGAINGNGHGTVAVDVEATGRAVLEIHCDCHGNMLRWQNLKLGGY